METSKESIGETLFDLTSYVADTPVNLSVPLDDAQAKTIRDTCGLGFNKPLAHFDPNTASWKMCVDTLPLVEPPLLETLPPSGMTRNGALFQQPAWEPITDATGSSLWPTPRAALGDARNHTVYARSTDKPQNLENKVGTADPSAIGGKLNPTWVEWLMGFPTGWTDLEDSATQ